MANANVPACAVGEGEGEVRYLDGRMRLPSELAYGLDDFCDAAAIGRVVVA